MGHIEIFDIKIADFSMTARITVNAGFFNCSNNTKEEKKFDHRKIRIKMIVTNGDEKNDHHVYCNQSMIS